MPDTPFTDRFETPEPAAQEEGDLSQRDPLAAQPQRPRDVSVSTVVRLMGLPTASEVAVLESKIDALNNKVSMMAARVERIASQIMEVFHDFDRVDVQITDLHQFTKQSLAAVVAKIDNLPQKSASTKRPDAAETESEKQVKES